MTNQKILVAYFSCSGVTKKAAQTVAHAVGGDLYEITPEAPYSAADLDWRNKNSRSSFEMSNQAIRPALAGNSVDIGKYDIVFVGFPIWWYVAPTIVNTFLESYDFTGKTVIPFATSGSSGMGQTQEKLVPSCSEGTKWKQGKLLNGMDDSAVKAWVNSLSL